MGKVATYDTDIVAWADEQAALLRNVARQTPVASNEIDWENIAEEIETVGRSETRAVMSAIRLLFVHLIKIAADPDATSVAHWRTEIITWLGEIRQDCTPAMIGKIDMQLLWSRARHEAESSLAEHGVLLSANISKTCPIRLVNLLTEPFTITEWLSLIKKDAEVEGANLYVSYNN